MKNFEKFDVIVHGCNCFCTMGSGFAKQIREHYPEAYEEDQKTKRGDRSKLGTISYAVYDDLIVVNAYTQYRYGRDGKRYIDYNALRSCFKEIKRLFFGLHIAYPKIGAGLAGGEWSLIKAIIDKELQGERHTYVER